MLLPTAATSTCSASATTKRPTLGTPVARVRLVVVVAATLGTAAVVSVSGLIGFVGIVVPHVVRLVAGSSYRRAAAAVAAARRRVPDPRRHPRTRAACSPAETPIGVVTAFLGAPFFIVVLRAAGDAPSDELAGASATSRVRYGKRGRWHRSATLVHSGEWLCLIGPNGAGKSSLLRAVAGLAESRGDDRSSTGRRWRCARAAGAPSSSPTCRSRRCCPTT